jgi:hypothetical protein
MSVTRAHVKRSDEWVAKSRDECGALWEKDEMTAVFWVFFSSRWQKENTKGEEGDKTKTKRQQQHQKKKENKKKQTNRQKYL